MSFPRRWKKKQSNLYMQIVETRSYQAETEGIMRKIVVSEFVSLDNVMQAPGGAEEDTEGGFTHGGWTGPFWHDDICAHLFQEISPSDAPPLGGKNMTIQGWATSTLPDRET